MKRETRLTLRRFVESASELLDLEVVGGEEHLDRLIPEASMNRPGLALAGSFKYFANKRVQVFGLAELTYLNTLSGEQREKRLRQFFAKKIPCVVVTRQRHVPVQLRELAAQAHVPVLKSRMITMDFINAGTVIMDDLASPEIRAHGTMVDLMGIGVLIRGEPGIGKSETALALIERGHSLVADDITVLRRERGGAIMASAVELTRYHMEIRGLGLVHVPSLFGVASVRARMHLDLIVDLCREGQDEDVDRTGLSPQSEKVLDEPIPRIRLPVAAGRDLALIIETAALNQKLKFLGHDAAKELDEKLISILTRRAKEGP